MGQGPLSRYQALLDEGSYLPDDAQKQTVTALDGLWQRLQHQPQPGLFDRLLGKSPAPVTGLYLWGGVGRGKTWLMDLFFDSLSFKEKRRVHFHRFMQQVHDGLRSRSHEQDPLPSIAQEWAGQYRVLCFDEFFVSDIADAMLLAGLLGALFDQGVTLVATSNVHPDDLYKEGLQRAKFIPAIELLKQHTQVLMLDTDTDYRLRILEQAEIFHYPLDDAAEVSLKNSFQQMSPGCSLSPEFEINNRLFTARARGDGIIWFDFDELCRKPRGTHDYIEIARQFNTVLLSGVPQMGKEAADADAARRFLHLVDEFYDRNVKLLLSAACAPSELYTGQRLAFEFERAESRLIEMQSHEYLARPHLP